MSYVGKMNVNASTYHVASTLYGTCDTAAGTAAKVAVVDGFDTLETGVTVHIKFTYSNTAANPTLAIKPTSMEQLRQVQQRLHLGKQVQ